MAAGPDPGAVYNTTVADLGRQAAFEEGKIGENLGFQESDVTRAENELTRQEPVTYRGEANRANKGGLMTSGINARRKGEIATNFSAKRAADEARLLRARTEAKKLREGVGIKRETGEHGAAQRRAEGEAALVAANPGVEPAGIAPGFLPQPGSTVPGGGYGVGNTTNVRIGPGRLPLVPKAKTKMTRIGPGTVLKSQRETQ